MKKIYTIVKFADIVAVSVFSWHDGTGFND